MFYYQQWSRKPAYSVMLKTKKKQNKTKQTKTKQLYTSLVQKTEDNSSLCHFVLLTRHEKENKIGNFTLSLPLMKHVNLSPIINHDNSQFFYSAFSLQQFPYAVAIIIAFVRQSSESLRFIYSCNRPTCTTYRTLDYDIPITATRMSLRSTSQARLNILIKDTNTLALAGLELTTFRLWVLLCSAGPHALSKNTS